MVVDIDKFDNDVITGMKNIGNKVYDIEKLVELDKIFYIFVQGQGKSCDRIVDGLILRYDDINRTYYNFHNYVLCRMIWSNFSSCMLKDLVDDFGDLHIFYGLRKILGLEGINYE